MSELNPEIRTFSEITFYPTSINYDTEKVVIVEGGDSIMDRTGFRCSLWLWIHQPL